MRTSLSIYYKLRNIMVIMQKLYLIKGKGRGEDMRRMREFAPIMSSPEHHEGIQNSNFPQTMGKYTNCFF